MLQLICQLLFLVVLISSVISSDLNNIPRSIKQRNNKVIIGASAAAALTAFKVYADGPTFNENVDLNGKIIAITGGNTGLGKDSAIKLASLGAQIVILSRPSKKTEDAVKEIVKLTGNNKVEAIPLDLADLSSVKACADILKSKYSKIDVLMNNAGVMAIPERQQTKDGFEMQMGVNHIGHFLLTNELMPLLKKAPAARVVNLSSSAHLFSKLDKDDFMLEKPDAYKPWIAYGNTKLSNILFTNLLAKKLNDVKSTITTYSCHPGACRTELGRYIVDPATIPSYILPLLAIPAAPLLYATKSSKQGAQTQIYLSASTKVVPQDSGKYYDNSRIATPSAEARDMNTAEWLWKESEKRIGKSFQV